MTSVLSSISGQFSKSWILGAFFPVVVFIFLGMVFVAPLFPSDWSFPDPIPLLGSEWKIVVILFLAIVLSGLLYNLSIPILRLYEGYPWMHSLVGQWCIRRYKTRLYAAEARWKGMRTLVRALPAEYEEYRPRIRAERDRNGRIYNSEFPQDEAFVLPTRLGNVIRSFEDYSYRQYGMESITLWPRLVAKIDKDYAAAIDEARTSFDFMINSSLLSAILSLAVLVPGLMYGDPLNQLQIWPPVALHWWLLTIMVFAASAYLFYYLSIGRAGAWGNMVRGAFDLYRWDLLQQLGYKQVPTTIPEERELWEDIYQQMVYGDLPVSRFAQYANSTTFASGAPFTVKLETTRGVTVLDSGKKVRVYLRVENGDKLGRTAKDVVVTDTLPDGFDYEWGSAREANSGQMVHVVGTNPYEFSIGNLEPSDTPAIVTYRAVRSTPL